MNTPIFLLLLWTFGQGFKHNVRGGPYFPILLDVSSQRDEKNSSTTNGTTNGTQTTDDESHHYGAIARSVSVLHPKLQIPKSERVPINTVPDANLSFALFCGGGSNRSNGNQKISSIGNGLQRYTTAVQERLSEKTDTRSNSKTAAESSLLTLFQTAQRHTRRHDEYVFISADIYGGKCSNDNDCVSFSPRKYCIEGLCRECSGSTVGSDCPSGLSEFCSAKTGYTCSDCETDDDCDPDSGAVCRAVFPDIAPVPMMPRKQCTTCDKVPETAEIFDVTKCDWRCPFGTSRSSDESACIVNPTCAADEYLGPSGSDGKNFFYSVGTDSVSPACTDCSIPFGDVFTQTDFCASLVNSTYGSITGEPVGDLNRNDTLQKSSGMFPCNNFICKSGWTLNRQQNQCQECLYNSCDPGYYLDGCLGNSTGTCTPCNPGILQGDPNARWLEMAKITGKVLNISSNPSITCTTICAEGYYRSKTDGGLCSACADLERSSCRIGQILEDCGPGSDSGRCVDCPPAGPENFWTGNKCAQASCAEKTCPPGSFLKGCGLGVPGECTPCPGGLPATATNWVKGCDFICPVGSFVQYIGEPSPLSIAEANRTCTTCTDISNQCPDGTVLTGCGVDGVSRGTCRACKPAGLGIYYKVETQCQPHRCDASILCNPGEVLLECGFGSRGRCEFQA